MTRTTEPDPGADRMTGKPIPSPRPGADWHRLLCLQLRPPILADRPLDVRVAGDDLRDVRRQVVHRQTGDEHSAEVVRRDPHREHGYKPLKRSLRSNFTHRD
jgi:hypothetical protein